MIKIIILAIVQGFTEFLPISSSGHLAILENLMDIQEIVGVTAFLHLGTFIATIVYFRKDIYEIIKGLMKRESSAIRYVVNIIIGSIPIMVFAVLFRDYVENSFMELRLIIIFLGITGAILLLTSIIPKGENPLSPLRAFAIGIGQMFAAFPGLSRSGLTISSGIYMKIDRIEAFRFSFLLSLPAIFGANLLEIKKVTHLPNPLEIIIGLIISFISGLIALRLLRSLVQKWFYLFGFYCLIISLIFFRYLIL